MTGGAAGADAGTLTLMIGGEAAAIARCRDLLACFTGRTFHVGPQGSGHALKLIHNMVLHAMFLANCEGVRAAGRFGIDARAVIEVFNAGNARSYSSQVRFPEHILSGTWDARSRVANLEKDVRMAADMSARMGAPTPFGDLAAALLAKALALGMADTDFSRLYEAFEDLAKN
jgi:3-hydroxyisobutyrate dehydrogenase